MGITGSETSLTFNLKFINNFIKFLVIKKLKIFLF